MQFKTLIPATTLLLAATVTTVTAQNPTPTNAIASVSALVSWQDSVLSSLNAQASTNTIYSSIFGELTSVWDEVKSELMPVTAAAATNAAVSRSLDSYVSRNGAQWSSITAQTSFSLPTDAAGASAFVASLTGPLATASAVVATNNAATTASGTLATANAAAPGLGGPQVGLMGAGAVGVLGLAALL